MNSSPTLTRPILMSFGKYKAMLLISLVLLRHWTMPCIPFARLIDCLTVSLCLACSAKACATRCFQLVPPFSVTIQMPWRTCETCRGIRRACNRFGLSPKAQRLYDVVILNLGVKKNWRRTRYIPSIWVVGDWIQAPTGHSYNLKKAVRLLPTRACNVLWFLRYYVHPFKSLAIGCLNFFQMGQYAPFGSCSIVTL